MSEWHAHVLPHSELKGIADGLWMVTGRLPRGHMPRNMTVMRLKSGELVIHSAIALNDDGMKKLEQLGSIKFMIVPNRLHRRDAAVYKARYPQLQVLCPEASRGSVSEKVPVDASCEEVLPQLGINCLSPAGIYPGELVYEVQTSDGRALITTDLLFNLPDLPGFDGWLFRILKSTGFFGMTKIGQLYMLKNRAAFKSWLENLARSSDIKAIIVGHGEPIVQDCGSKLSQAAARL